MITTQIKHTSSLQEQVTSLLNVFQKFAVKSSLSKKIVKGLIEKVDAIIFQARSERSLVVTTPEFQKLCSLTKTLYYNYEVHLEYLVSNMLERRLLSNPSNVDTVFTKYPQLKRTFEYARNEIEIHQEVQHIAHIGSGPCPESLLAMYKLCTLSKSHTDFTLSGIDQDLHAYQKSRKILKLLSLQKDIPIINKKAANVNYAKYTDIVVAIMVRPELETIQQICKTTSHTKDVRLYLRTVDKYGELAYAPLSEEVYKILEKAGFKRKSTIQGHTILHTEVFERLQG